MKKVIAATAVCGLMGVTALLAWPGLPLKTDAATAPTNSAAVLDQDAQISPVEIMLNTGKSLPREEWPAF